MEEYACPNCGATVACEGNTVATECVYCHTPVIHRGKLSGQMRPARIVPFKFDREAAQAAFLKFISKHKFVPRDFFAKEQLERIDGDARERGALRLSGELGICADADLDPDLPR